jgi:predicted permease
VPDRREITFRKPHLWLIALLGVIVPRRLRADWRMEWEAELRNREAMLTDWDRLGWRNKFDLLRRSLSAFWDALWLLPRRWEDDMIQDLRYAVRMLIHRPGFTFVAVATLALGIGVNTALFTLFDAFMLKPLPLKDPGSLVIFNGVDKSGERRNLFSYLDYLDYRARNTTLSDLVAWNKVAVVLGEARDRSDDLSVMREGSGYLFGQIVSANYFSALGAEMALGRGFLPEEERAPGERPVVVLSHFFWQRQFNGDPNVVGKTIRLQGQPFTIVGVTAREFIGTTADTPAFWAPLMMRDQLILPGGWNHRRWLTERDADSFVLVGHFKTGLSQAQARADLNVIAQGLALQFPSKGRKTGVMTKSGASFIPFDVELLPLIAPLLVAVALVLLIACANVANLLLARAVIRQKEIGVRLALGASRFRVIRQLLTESVLVSGIGGLAGLLTAWWTLRALCPLALARLPIPATMRESFSVNLEPDYRIFGFTLLITLIAGVAAGLAPALQASRPDLNSALKDEGSTFGQHLSQSRLRNGLIVTQLAVSLALLIAAGLLVRNLQRAQTIDLGFEPQNLLSVAVNLPLDSNVTSAESARKGIELRRRLAERLRALPGVKSVSQAFRQPSTGAPPSAVVTIAGRASPDGHPFLARYNFVSPEHFETLGIRIVRGRGFTEREANSDVPVVVVSEAAAMRFWPGQDAIGQHIGVAAAALGPGAESGAARQTSNSGAAPSYEVIGVARDTRSGWVWQKDEAFLYAPLGPDNRLGDYLLVRAAGNAERVMAEARGEAEAIDPRLSVVAQRTSDHLDVQMTPFRALALIAGALGALALLLASVGLYGVMSFVVTHRTREIGVRVALGAHSADVVRLFLKEGLRLTVVGLAIGLAIGAGVSRLLTAALIGLSPLDPLAFGGVSIFLTLVALLATYLPARQATKVDPMAALRRE